MDTNFPLNNVPIVWYFKKVYMTISDNFDIFWCVKCDKTEEIDDEEGIALKSGEYEPESVQKINNIGVNEVQNLQSLKEKQKKSDEASQKIGDYLLSGWAMLAEHCASFFNRLFDSINAKSRSHKMCFM